MPAHAPSIMLAAGEASGDLHGAALCHALRAEAPGCRLFGMGGERMAAAGMDLLVDVTAVAVAGGTEALSRIPPLYRAYRRLRATLAGARRPGVLVVVDFPEFNLRLARAARQAGIPVVYFIPPQIWAWRSWRVRTIRRVISRVLAVFPFETALYRRAGVPVEFVGHPLLDALAGAPDRVAARRALGLDDRALVIGLLPGSRREETARVLPAMREAVTAIGRARRDARFVLALAPTVEPATVERGLGVESPVAIAHGRRQEWRRERARPRRRPPGAAACRDPRADARDDAPHDGGRHGGRGAPLGARAPPHLCSGARSGSFGAVDQRADSREPRRPARDRARESLPGRGDRRGLPVPLRSRQRARLHVAGRP